MLKIRRGKKDDYIGEEWMSLLDRIRIPDFYQPNSSAQGGEIGIIEEKCDGCGLCVKICPADTLVLKHRSLPPEKGKRKITKVMAMAEVPECVACGDCAAICPNDACFVSKQVKMTYSIFKTINRGPLSLPRLFNEE